MNRAQRFKYEMFVRVRDYGTAHTALFPESSAGSQSFARVTAAVAAIDDHLKNRVVARAARSVKAATRDAVFDAMKTLALAARRVTRPEPGISLFRMPRRRSLKVEISTARAFIEEMEKRQDQFVKFGLPPTFISDFRTLVDNLQRAVDVRLSSRTVRGEVQAGIETTLAEGLEVVRDLDAIVAIATRQDPVALAAWQTARRIEGQGSSSPVSEKAPAVEVTASPVPAPEPAAISEAPDPGLALRRAS